MMWWYDGHWGWGGAVLMTLTMLTFWAVVVGAVVLVVRTWRTEATPRSGGGDSNQRAAIDALEVLDERFARGEIDAEEYTQRRGLLLRR